METIKYGTENSKSHTEKGVKNGNGVDKSIIGLGFAGCVVSIWETPIGIRL
jgi:hypothetical protein